MLWLPALLTFLESFSIPALCFGKAKLRLESAKDCPCLDDFVFEDFEIGCDSLCHALFMPHGSGVHSPPNTTPKGRMIALFAVFGPEPVSPFGSGAFINNVSDITLYFRTYSYSGN